MVRRPWRTEHRHRRDSNLHCRPLLSSLLQGLLPVPPMPSPLRYRRGMSLLAMYRRRRPLVPQTSSHRCRYHPLRLRCRRRRLPHHALSALPSTRVQEDRPHPGRNGGVLVPSQLVYCTGEASSEAIDTLEACW